MREAQDKQLLMKPTKRQHAQLHPPKVKAGAGFMKPTKREHAQLHPPNPTAGSSRRRTKRELSQQQQQPADLEAQELPQPQQPSGLEAMRQGVQAKT